MFDLVTPEAPQTARPADSAGDFSLNPAPIQSATFREIESLIALNALEDKRHVLNMGRQIARARNPDLGQPKARSERRSKDSSTLPPAPAIEENFKDYKSFTPTGAALSLSPIDLHHIISPGLTLHPWQYEELLRFSNSIWNADKPYLLALRAPNGSGKDEIIITRCAVWLALSGFKNRFIITTSSGAQLKYQTAPHIAFAANQLNKAFGSLFISTQQHHFCPRTGSEILMFVTDESKRAEGYHPWEGGKMALVVNEAKSVSEPIFDALNRCTGYSHMMYISSPGRRTGRFYVESIGGVQHPEPHRPGKFFTRRVPITECTHIPQSHIDRMRNSMSPAWIASSIDAEFSDEDDPSVIIPEFLWERLLAEPAPKTSGDISIGADFGAGKDENSIYVRSGNYILYEFHFIHKDTTQTAERIDRELAHFKSKPYKFNADDGGVGHAIIDMLVKAGWHITRRHNQSAALDKSRYLNFGAESYFHVRRLIEHSLINVSNQKRSNILSEQLTRRRAIDIGNGKKRLEKKSEVRDREKWSPDRADAFILSFWTYRPKFRGIDQIDTTPKKRIVSFEEFDEKYTWGSNPYDRFNQYLQSKLRKPCFLRRGL